MSESFGDEVCKLDVRHKGPCAMPRGHKGRCRLAGDLPCPVVHPNTGGHCVYNMGHSGGCLTAPNVLRCRECRAPIPPPDYRTTCGESGCLPGTWIVKVGDQYLSWRAAGSARCSKKQRDALRFSTEGKAYRAAHKTFGLGDPLDDDDDDDMAARVVRLIPRTTSARSGKDDAR